MAPSISNIATDSFEFEKGAVGLKAGIDVDQGINSHLNGHVSNGHLNGYGANGHLNGYMISSYDILFGRASLTA